MALVGHPLHHEYEVISKFLYRGATWVKIEEEAVSLHLGKFDSPSEECIEDVFCGPAGPVELERIICRSTINELNALIEIALQEALQIKTSSFVFNSNTFIIGARFNDLVAELAKHGIDVNSFPNFHRVREIKELSEGFKHRQRLAPLPKFKNGTWAQSAAAIRSAEEMEFRQIELGIAETAKYLEDARRFLEYCQSMSII